jgi:hypothetical protein
MKSNGPEVYYTRERIEAFVVLIITSMIVALLIIPIYLLYRLTRGVETTRITAICIGVLLIFTLLFSAGIALFTSRASLGGPKSCADHESRSQEA